MYNICIVDLSLRMAGWKFGSKQKTEEPEEEVEYVEEEVEVDSNGEEVEYVEEEVEVTDDEGETGTKPKAGSEKKSGSSVSGSSLEVEEVFDIVVGVRYS